MKIVINRCYGGYGLSAEAALEVYRRGGKIKVTPVDQYFCNQKDQQRALENWQEYKTGNAAFAMAYFTDDESMIISCYGYDREERSCPILVSVVEEMGAAANGDRANLKVVEIPDDIDWEIDDYDGIETVEEAHRSWP